MKFIEFDFIKWAIMEGNNVQQNSLISLPEEDLNDKMNHAEMNIDSMKKSADQDFINDATDSENVIMKIIILVVKSTSEMD